MHQGLWKLRLQGPPSNISGSIGLWRGLRICLSNKFPGDAEAACLGATLLRTTGLEQSIKTSYASYQAACSYSTRLKELKQAIAAFQTPMFQLQMLVCNSLQQSLSNSSSFHNTERLINTNCVWSSTRHSGLSSLPRTVLPQRNWLAVQDTLGENCSSRGLSTGISSIYGVVLCSVRFCAKCCQDAHGNTDGCSGWAIASFIQTPSSPLMDHWRWLRD